MIQPLMTLFPHLIKVGISEIQDSENKILKTGTEKTTTLFAKSTKNVKG